MNLQVERLFSVPRARVFAAFSEASALERWFCPVPEVDIAVRQFEFRPGGRYRFHYQFPSGGSVVTGQYLTIDPPNRLIFTWTWEPPDPHAGVETLVTIDFTEESGGTRVIVQHERFPTEALVERHRNGWARTLDRLPALLEKESI